MDVGAARLRVPAIAARWAHPGATAATALVIALGLYFVGLPGNDEAAHVYQTEMFERHGWYLWHNLWYGGHYAQVNYSLTYYPLAATLGTWVVVVGSAAGAAAGFSLVVRRQWPRIAAAPAIAFAVTVPLAVISATYPFLLGLVPALFAIVAVQRRRPLLATLLVALTAATHPLAFGFLVSLLIALAVVTRCWWRVTAWRILAGGVVAVTAVQAVVTRAFTSPGAMYPFDEKDAMAIAAFCVAGGALTARLKTQRVLFAFFVAYAVISVIAFAISSPVGGNVGRLILLLGVPLLLLPVAERGFRPRWVAFPIIAGVTFWQVLPAITGWRSIAPAGAPEAAFWTPVDDFLQQHADPNHRVHVVATVDDWEAYYVARRGVALTRGWLRQYDWPPNRVLYEPLTPTVYRDWLRQMGVRYVFLSDDPLDYSAGPERDLLRSGTGLSVVKTTDHWTVYELPAATPIATPVGAIRIVKMTTDRIDFYVDRAGVYDVRVRYTPYWRVDGGRGCVAPVAPFGMKLHAFAAGRVSLSFDVAFATVIRTALGRNTEECRSPIGITADES